MKPNCYIIAGGNGVGKTTFAECFLPEYTQCRNFINPDYLAKAYAQFDPNGGVIQAGRIALARIAEFQRGARDFAFETTLSGRSYLNTLASLKRSGYALNMFYLWIPSCELTLARIKGRVALGGHDVPEAAVRRRYTRTLANLFTLYLPLLDTLYFYENSERIPRMVFKRTHDEMEIVNEELYTLLQHERTLK